MTVRHKRTLLCLKAIGPCSNRELAAALKMTAGGCYTLVSYLRKLKFVNRLGHESYAISSEGRRELLCGSRPVEQKHDLFAEAGAG